MSISKYYINEQLNLSEDKNKPLDPKEQNAFLRSSIAAGAAPIKTAMVPVIARKGIIYLNDIIKKNETLAKETKDPSKKRSYEEKANKAKKELAYFKSTKGGFELMSRIIGRNGSPIEITKNDETFKTFMNGLKSSGFYK